MRCVVARRARITKGSKDMIIRKLALAGVVSLMGSAAWSACAFENDVEVKSLSAGFEAWKAVTDAMAECGNVQADDPPAR